jgi:2-aminoethylphosphonate-pyruvate transaminase
MNQDTQIRLMNPGPVSLSSRVRKALLRQDLCHRQREFSCLQADVIRRLANVYMESSEDYTAVLFTGSGTAAVEAMVGSLVPRRG